jgi:transaldolase
MEKDRKRYEMSNTVREVQEHGQSVWYDNIRRGLFGSGELKRLIDLGVTGLTSNPTIFQKAIAESSDYDDAFEEMVGEGKSTDEVYESLVIDDIRAAADLLRPVYEGTDGVDGYASLEVSPHLAHDTGATVSEGRRLFAALDRPNVMVKVPATPEGIPAVHRLIGEGINVNVTLLFSLRAHGDAMQAYISGLEDLQFSGGDVSSVASVGSFFVSRVDGVIDSKLEGRNAELMGKAAVANARLAYRDFKEEFGGDRFALLRANGARVQRPLWASTSTKNPEYSDVMYVDSLIGADTVNTMPEPTLLAFLEHGAVADTLEEDVEGAERLIEDIESAGVSMEEVTAGLLADGVRQFTESFDQLMANIADKRAALLAGE